MLLLHLIDVMCAMIMNSTELFFDKKELYFRGGFRHLLRGKAYKGMRAILNITRGEGSTCHALSPT